MHRSRVPRPSALAALAAVAILTLAGPCLAAETARDAVAVVRAFNEALSARNLDQAVAQLAPGGVQFNLRPAHAGMGGQPQGLTTELKAQWSMIGPVVFASTKTYSRKVEVVDSRAEGDVATVWTRTTTETTRADTPQPRRDSFVEVYLVVRKDGQWKIGAVADNRNPIGAGGGAPAGASGAGGTVKTGGP